MALHANISPRLTAAFTVIDLLASEEPLKGIRPEGALERALLAVLEGKRDEAEPWLTQARARALPGARASTELSAALVMLEAGYPARAMGAIERAESTAGALDTPELRALSHGLHARVLRMEGAAAFANRAAEEGLANLAGTWEPGALRAWLELTSAECLLAAGDTVGATSRLERATGAPGCAGLLALRAEVLRARIALAPPAADTERLRGALETAISRLLGLGVPRDLGLAYLTLAEVQARAGAGAAAYWLAQAQPLLAHSGTAEDLRELRHAFRRHGRRRVDRLMGGEVEPVAEALHERHARLKDMLSAQRDARGSLEAPTHPAVSFLARTVDAQLESLHEAGAELLCVLERALADRERTGQLVDVGRELALLHDEEALRERVPRLASGLIHGVRAELLQQEEGGSSLPTLRDPAPDAPPPERLREALDAALREGTRQVVMEAPAPPTPPRRDVPFNGGRYAVLPLKCPGRRLVLVVGRTGSRAPLDSRDLEHLSVFASMASSALARARSSASLRQSAARDAATLAAIRDGIVTLEQDGTIRALNQAAMRMLHVTEAEATSRRLQDVPTLAPLAVALEADRPLTDEPVTLPHGELLVRAQPFEGGTVITLQEMAQARRLAHRLVGAQARFTFADFVGQAPVLRACLEDARHAARSDVPILITGESGTGKELLAQALHRASSRASTPFIGINVAALPRELLESELFGYEQGAFTGARARGNPGKLELAERGTLLLDEIGDMPLEMQVKLLRVLQERTYQRLGGSRDLSLEARVVATTHKDLEKAVAEGTFRLDLFHRLRVVHLRLPPLRERREDIPLLVEHHLGRYASRLRRGPLRVAPAVMDALLAYDWPGNVRELANLMEGAACLLPEGQTVITRVPAPIESALQAARAPCPSAVPQAPGDTTGPRVLPIEELERRAFEHALRHFGGNVTQAARALGVAKGTFYSKIRRYGLVSEPPPKAAPGPGA
jgi:transcriptional regulator with PAS, ATPase and Fis domain